MLITTNISYGQFINTINGLGKNYREIFEEQYYLDNDTLQQKFKGVNVDYYIINDTIVKTVMNLDFKQDNIIYINTLLKYYINNSKSIFYDVTIEDTFDYNDLIFKMNKSTMYILTELHDIEFTVILFKKEISKIILSYELKRGEE